MKNRKVLFVSMKIYLSKNLIFSKINGLFKLFIYRRMDKIDF